MPPELRYWLGDDDAPIPERFSVPERALMTDTLAEFDAFLTPAPQAEIVALLTRLAVHFPVRGRSQSEWRIILEDFAEDLAPYPPDILRAAIAEYRQTGRYWPRPAELIALAAPALARRQRIRHRLMRALGAPPLRIVGEPA